MRDTHSQEITSFQPKAENARLLRSAFGQFATGVTVVTAWSEMGPVCATVNSFSSVSLDPALLLWSADKTARRYGFFENAQHFAVHVLAQEQAEICGACARDVFALRAMECSENAHSVPLLDHCLARFECVRNAAHDAGDHKIIIGEITDIQMREGDALAFFAGQLGEMAAP